MRRGRGGRTKGHFCQLYLMRFNVLHWPNFVMVILVFCFILKFFFYFCFQGNMTAFKPTQCLRKSCIKILINMLGMKSCYCFKDFLAGAPRDILTPSPLLQEVFGTLTMIFLQGTSVWNLPLKNQNICDPTAFSTSPPPSQ